MRNFLKKNLFSGNKLSYCIYLFITVFDKFFYNSKKLNEENRTIINNLAKAKENYEQFKLKKLFSLFDN